MHTLSGGQRQLLALAGVLATEPAIVVADEPTTLLDLANTRRVAEVLFGLEQQLVLVTHDLDLAAPLRPGAGRRAGAGCASTGRPTRRSTDYLSTVARR